MGQILAYIVALLFALPICALFVLFIAADFVRTKEYNHANKTTAKILNYAGAHRTANYGKYQAATKYHKYVVEFVAGDKTYQGDYLCKDASLKQGQEVEIRYVLEKDKTARLVNRDIRDRFYCFLLCVLIAIPFSVLCIILFK